LGDKKQVQGPSEGRYTNASRERVDTYTRREVTWRIEIGGEGFVTRLPTLV
jgi:hypothetical protein